jgi:hypothetical protein
MTAAVLEAGEEFELRPAGVNKFNDLLGNVFKPAS